MLVMKWGRLVWDFIRSYATTFKDEKGLSRTTPAIFFDFFKCNNAVTAPILLPQRPIVLTFPLCLRNFTTTFKSSFSKYPSEIYFPSLCPHPEKSKTNTEIFKGTKIVSRLLAALLEELFPWRKITQGSYLQGLSTGVKWEQASRWPLWFCRVKSLRFISFLSITNCFGPKSLIKYLSLGGLIIAFHNSE